MYVLTNGETEHKEKLGTRRVNQDLSMSFSGGSWISSSRGGLIGYEVESPPEVSLSCSSKKPSLSYLVAKVHRDAGQHGNEDLINDGNWIYIKPSMVKDGDSVCNRRLTIT